MHFHLPLADSIQTFLMPLWLLSVGATLGMSVLLLVWGILWLVWRPAAWGAVRSMREGILLPLTYLVSGMAVFAVSVLIWDLAVGSEFEVRRALASVRRVGAVGETQRTATIPAAAEDHEVPISFRSEELVRYQLQSDQDLAIGLVPRESIEAPRLVIQGAEEPVTWNKGDRAARAFDDTVSRILVTNNSDLDATLRMQMVTEVTMPEVYGLTTAAAAVIGLYVIYMAISGLLPRMSAIAVTTAKEAIAQPLYVLVLIIGVVGVVVSIYIPYHTFGEDVKMFKNVGMDLIMLLAMVVALWTASVSIADEIDGRTALTVLSKPIGRTDFVLGKFLGITWAMLLMFVVIGLVLLASVSWKVIYDAREAAKTPPEWQQCYETMVTTVPGLVLAFLQAIVMASIAVALSTRLPMLPNLLICGAIYVIGWMTPQIVQTAAGEIEFVAFVAQLFGTMLPVFDHFRIESAIAGGLVVPYDYLGWATLYAGIYCCAAMLLALAMFHNRDLA